MAKREYEFIAVDFQKDFTETNGLCYVDGSSIDFVKHELTAFLLEKNIKAHEIISDYRLPRLSRKISSCDPNTEGFVSELSDEIKYTDPWIKCMHNPLWTRDNIGLKDKEPGIPYQDPVKFDLWLKNHIGFSNDNKEIVIFGLTMEVCVLALAQELYFRGYKVNVLYEATDPMNERMKYKDFIAKHSTLSLYANILSFKELKKLMIGCDSCE